MVKQPNTSLKIKLGKGKFHTMSGIWYFCPGCGWWWRCYWWHPSTAAPPGPCITSNGWPLGRALGGEDGNGTFAVADIYHQYHPVIPNILSPKLPPILCNTITNIPFDVHQKSYLTIGEYPNGPKHEYKTGPLRCDQTTWHGQMGTAIITRRTIWPLLTSSP